MIKPPVISRRRLLIGSAATATLFSTSGFGAELAGKSFPSTLLAPLPLSPGLLPADAWTKLRTLAAGRLLLPGDVGYAEAAIPHNLRYKHIRPGGIVACTSVEVIAGALQWAKDNDMPFAIRGGGHSYAGYSSSSGVVLDMSPMNGIDYRAGNGRVRVGAGASNAEVYAALRTSGRMITHGRCPTVGVAGFLLGGGIGFNMRRLGMACDLLTEATLVTADGRHRTVSHLREPDLFWALRGGAGGNFGVSTSFTLQTQPADERLTVFKVNWTSNTRKVAGKLMAAMDAAPVALGARVSLGAITPEQHRQGKEVQVNILGQFAGSRAALMRILAPAFAEAAPAESTIEEQPYWDAQDFLSEKGDEAWFQERSTFVQEQMKAAMLDDAFRWLRQWPGTTSYCDVRFFQTGGRINEVAANATAYVHRNSRWLMSTGLNWTAKDALQPEVLRRAHEWHNGVYQAMRSHGTKGAFQNFPDPSLVDWRDMYYGQNLPRLKRIKALIDPTNIFNYGQSI